MLESEFWSRLKSLLKYMTCFEEQKKYVLNHFKVVVGMFYTFVKKSPLISDLHLNYVLRCFLLVAKYCVNHNNINIVQHWVMITRYKSNSQNHFMLVIKHYGFFVVLFNRSNISSHLVYLIIANNGMTQASFKFPIRLSSVVILWMTKPSTIAKGPLSNNKRFLCSMVRWCNDTHLVMFSIILNCPPVVLILLTEPGFSLLMTWQRTVPSLRTSSKISPGGNLAPRTPSIQDWASCSCSGLRLEASYGVIEG